jgi:hypothetical protein
MHSFPRPSRRLGFAAALFSFGIAANAGCSGDVTIGDMTGDDAGAPDSAHNDAAAPGKDGATATDSATHPDSPACDPAGIRCRSGYFVDPTSCMCVPYPADAPLPNDACDPAGIDCLVGYYVDPTTCMCVPYPTDAPLVDDACPPTGIDCKFGYYWDPSVCMCVPYPTDAGPDACLGGGLCGIGTHWDDATCMCVPDATDAAADACGVRALPCPVFEYWDPGVCACVANDAGVCISGKGGKCGGFTVNPCQCATGLTCVYEAGITDLAGTCQ